MVVVAWGQHIPSVDVQWGALAGDTEIIERQDSPNPIAVVIATGSGEPVHWASRQW